MSPHDDEENQPTLVRIAFRFLASRALADISSVMFIISRTTPSIALRPSSKMLVMSWCERRVVGDLGVSADKTLGKPR
eukprot:5533973-Pleurochrysis_carterae.AAC.3